MVNKLKSIIFIGAFSILFTCFTQADIFRPYRECVNGHYKPIGYRTIDPNDIESAIIYDEGIYHNNIKNFRFSHKIIKRIYEIYIEKFGKVPPEVERDLQEADAAWQEFKTFVFDNISDDDNIIESILLSWTLYYCQDMYNKEVNDKFGEDFPLTIKIDGYLNFFTSHLTPADEDLFGKKVHYDGPFEKDNFICNTGYQDALDNIRYFLFKYRNDCRCQKPKDKNGHYGCWRMKVRNKNDHLWLNSIYDQLPQVKNFDLNDGDPEIDVILEKPHDECNL